MGIMTVKKGQTIECTISDLAIGGRGLVKIDGMAVFVDQAVPQDRVSMRVYKRRKSYAEARVLELLEPSPFRVDPPCPYSGFCGGCKWQFLAYDKQLEYKQQHVVDALAHIGLFKDVSVNPVVPSDPIFGYRNKMEFSCSDRRWMMPHELGREDVDVGFALGLHVPGTFYKVLDIGACLLQPDLGNAILEDARRFMKASGAPAYGLRSHEGFWRFLMLRHSVARDEWLVNIITSQKDLAVVRPLAEQFMETYPAVVSVVNNVTDRKAAIAIGEYEVHLAGKDHLTDNIGELEFDISANSFFQTNSRGAHRLYDVVKQYAGLTGGETVLDLYCGTGTIAIALAPAAKTVLGMEVVESAVADAEKNCRHNNISNCRFILGDIRHGLPQLDVQPDVVIIDPPRVGMHKDVVKQLLNIAPERMVYVSCNPSTMARDLDMMRDVYEITAVQPVDMFPHTYHIEAVAKLKKIKGKAHGGDV
jgi:23S rRNA (uracil1939-C5)-methyltransferase